MSSKGLRFCPGAPAALCLPVEAAIDLPAVVDALGVACPTMIWLDSARRHVQTGRFSVLGWDPWLTLRASGHRRQRITSAGSQTTHGDPLNWLRSTLRGYPGPQAAGLPPIGLGLLGFLGYELNRWIERLPSPKPSARRVPDLLMFGMGMVVVVDHARARSWCVSVVDPHQPQRQAVHQARVRLEAFQDLLTAPHSPSARHEGFAGCAVEPTMSQAQYEAIVRAAKRHIRSGDIFQANLAHRFVARYPGSPRSLALRLRRVNPSPFACVLECPDFAIVGCSPERLVRVHRDRVDTRPIAGTRPRGLNAGEDLINSLELMLSDKERAEHIMLVDLERNDLGRICRTGSVRVDELMTLEDYSHVIHIVSQIGGSVRRGVDTVDVIRAMFPGGTITGCPKVRCMEIISALEPVARGVYTGSLGYLGFGGGVDLNILIRTMVLQDGEVDFHVGAGIVADSQPDREYHETLAKAGAMVAALQPPRGASTSRWTREAAPTWRGTVGSSR